MDKGDKKAKKDKNPLRLLSFTELGKGRSFHLMEIN